jgi:MFS transporter, YNFM family, putative membrane transport protein
MNRAEPAPTDALPPHDSAPAPGGAIWTQPGSEAYRRISGALFLAGFATFSLLYCVQPLLPLFTQDFRVSPAQSSLALSLATGALALAIVCASVASEAFGRRGLMFFSMCAAALLNIAVAFAPGWHGLLILRAVEGFVLGGVPAVAMAYLAEEIDPRGLGLAMGLYVGGTAFGGMAGRVGVGILAEFTSWRVAMMVLGAIGLAAAVGFVAMLPASRNFRPRPGFDARYHLAAWAAHLRHPRLPRVFLIGFLVMGAFVTVYNYAGFRLLGPPYRLSQTAISLVFSVYLFGIAASSLAGLLADRLGRGVVLVAGVAITAAGLALTTLHGLAFIILGIVVLTIGFFVSHSVASGWVGRLAVGAKGHASSLYLLAYYLGSSVAGSAGGWFWSEGGWPAVAGFTGTMLALAFVVAITLDKGERVARRTSPERPSL